MNYFLNTYIYLFLTFSFCGLGSRFLMAQEKLSFEEVVQIALENNYAIKVAKNNQSLKENNVSRGNAGMLPSLSANANLNYSNNNTKLEIATSDENGQPEILNIQQNGAETWQSGASLNANYTIFGGLSRVRTYKRLQTDAEASQVQTRQSKEQLLLNLAQTYYALVRLSNNLDIARQSLEISQARLSRVQNANEFGVNNRLAVLNAEVDINSDSINLVRAELEISNAQRNLNQLMARDLNTSFEVEREVDFQNTWSLDDLVAKTKNNNVSVLNAQYQTSLAELDLEIAQSAQYPTLNTNAAYSFNRTDNEVGLLLVNQTAGFSAGLSLSFNIFNGGQRKTQIQSSKIQLESRKLNLKEIESQSLEKLENALATYQNRLRIFRLEEKSVETAGLNFSRTEEQYKFGQISSTQFREAQLNLVQAQNRQIEAAYEAKLAEINILQLSGQILEEE